jgi:hypothetical protein
MNTIAVPVSTEPFPAMLDSGQRCQFISADGRRCAMLRWEPHPTLCLCHARAEALTASQQSPSRQSHLKDSDEEPAEAFDFTPPSGEFHTATDVNRALGKIFCLLAQNRIPRRKAVALGYLGQLLLQTLPQVREEINDCLGYKAWTETLESAFYEDEPEEEPSAPEDKNATKADAQNEVGNEVRNVGPGFSPAAFPPGTPISASAETTELTSDGCTCSPPQKLAAHQISEHESEEHAEDIEDQSNVGLRFSAAASPLGTPTSVSAETSELTGVGDTCSPPETDSAVPAEPEAVNTTAETAPETPLRGFVDEWRWQPPLVYTGPYKSYFDEPEVKEAFFRKYGKPIEEANKRVSPVK